MKNMFLDPSHLAKTIGREPAEAVQDAGAACFPRGGKPAASRLLSIAPRA